MKKKVLKLLLFQFMTTAAFCQVYSGNIIGIPAGSFTMGNNNAPAMFNDQAPEHTVTIDSFGIGETEVSNAQYVTFLNEMAQQGNLFAEEGVPGDWSSDSVDIANGHSWNIMADSTLVGEWAGQVLIELSNIAGGGQDSLNRCWIEWDSSSNVYSVVSGYENWPATWVSWYGAMMYVDYYGLSLPTEAEWEYAARANQQLLYPTDDGMLSFGQANYGSFTPTSDPNFLPYPAPVGTLFPANPFGLYNMAGNVSEWCLDWYREDFYQTCIDSAYCCNPINEVEPDSMKVKVIRGGNHTYPDPFAMSSHRFDTPPFVTTDHMGFRVVRRATNTSITKVATSESLQVFPNPASGTIQIVLEKEGSIPLEVSIYNYWGQLVLSKSIMNNDTLLLSALSSGNYVVLVTAKSKTYRQKIVMQ
ncbi:SUMF1/EgtB/PvdO family nonheme iron enzyme [Aureispira anguillae]|nr:SUMF1/EgtB/PvdO family nonheme iron enzyme [Aureispira anguillae]